MLDEDDFIDMSGFIDMEQRLRIQQVGSSSWKWL